MLEKAWVRLSYHPSRSSVKVSATLDQMLWRCRRLWTPRRMPAIIEAKGAPTKYSSVALFGQAAYIDDDRRCCRILNVCCQQATLLNTIIFSCQCCSKWKCCNFRHEMSERSWLSLGLLFSFQLAAALTTGAPLFPQQFFSFWAFTLVPDQQINAAEKPV